MLVSSRRTKVITRIKTLAFVSLLMAVSSCSTEGPGGSGQFDRTTNAAITNSMDFVTVVRQYRFASSGSGGAVDMAGSTQFRLHHGDPLTFTSTDQGDLQIPNADVSVAFIMAGGVCNENLKRIDIFRHDTSLPAAQQWQAIASKDLWATEPCEIVLSFEPRLSFNPRFRFRQLHTYQLPMGTYYVVATMTDGQFHWMSFENPATGF